MVITGVSPVRRILCGKAARRYSIVFSGKYKKLREREAGVNVGGCRHFSVLMAWKGHPFLRIVNGSAHVRSFSFGLRFVLEGVVGILRIRKS